MNRTVVLGSTSKYRAELMGRLGIPFERAAPEVEGHIVIGPTKTVAGTRTIPLPQVVIDALEPRIAGRAADRPAVTSPNGSLLRSGNWRRHTHWNKVLKKTHLAPLNRPGFDAHRLLVCSL